MARWVDSSNEREAAEKYMLAGLERVEESLARSRELLARAEAVQLRLSCWMDWSHMKSSMVASPAFSSPMACFPRTPSGFGHGFARASVRASFIEQ